MIEAANVWAQYSRCFFLSVVLGARDPNGRRIVPSVANSIQDAEDQAVYAIHPKLRTKTGPWGRRDLPDWQSKSHLLKALTYVNATVCSEVDTATGYATRVLQDLPTVRNFYAHKSQRSAQSARHVGRHYGITRRLAPHDLLCTPPKTGGDLLINEWLDDLSAILQLMP